MEIEQKKEQIENQIEFEQKFEQKIKYYKIKHNEHVTELLNIIIDHLADQCSKFLDYKSQIYRIYLKDLPFTDWELNNENYVNISKEITDQFNKIFNKMKMIFNRNYNATYVRNENTAFFSISFLK